MLFLPVQALTTSTVFCDIFASAIDCASPRLGAVIGSGLPVPKPPAGRFSIMGFSVASNVNGARRESGFSNLTSVDKCPDVATPEGVEPPTLRSEV